MPRRPDDRDESPLDSELHSAWTQLENARERAFAAEGEAAQLAARLGDLRRRKVVRAALAAAESRPGAAARALARRARRSAGPPDELVARVAPGSAGGLGVAIEGRARAGGRALAPTVAGPDGDLLPASLHLGDDGGFAGWVDLSSLAPGPRPLRLLAGPLSAWLLVDRADGPELALTTVRGDGHGGARAEGWAHGGGAPVAAVEAHTDRAVIAAATGLPNPHVGLAAGPLDAGWEIALSPAQAAGGPFAVVARDAAGLVACRIVPAVPTRTGGAAIVVETLLRRAGGVEVAGHVAWPDPPPQAPRVYVEPGGGRVAAAAATLSRPALAGRERCGFALRTTDPDPARPLPLVLRARDEHGRQVAVDHLLAPAPAELPAAGGIAAALRDIAAPGEPALDWGAGLVRTGVRALGEVELFAPPPGGDALPYADDSVAVVILGRPGDAARAEARRVARVAVIDATGAEARVDSLAAPAPRDGISVVVPVHGSPELTTRCLDAVLAAAPADRPLEVIAVEDASGEAAWAAVGAVAARDERVRALRNERNLGFVGTVNRGAAEARHPVLVLVNNDAELRPGALRALAGALDERPDAGAVCGRLIDDHGRLQEAGGAVFPDGHATQVGRGSWRPAAPEFSFRRPVAYGSAALLAVRRALWDELGGMATAYGEAYYEDTDLCLALRDRGHAVLYEPGAEAVHHEGAAYGSPESADKQRRLEANREVLVERWAAKLAAQPAAPAVWDRAAERRLLLGGAGRQALIVTNLVPADDRDGAAGHALLQARTLAEDGVHVIVVAEGATPADAGRIARLGREGIEVHAGPTAHGAADAYLADPRELLEAATLDLAVVHFYGLAERWLPLLRRHAPRTPVLVDSIDLHLVRLARERLDRAAPGAGLRATDALAVARELNAYAAADGVINVSEGERDLVDLLLGRDGFAHHVPLGRELDAFEGLPEFDARRGVLFAGNYVHPPNLEALRHLVDDVLPQLPGEVRAAHPLDVVGYGLDDGTAAWLAATPEVTPIGWVPALSPYMSRARVMCAPLLAGAGVKNKLLDAMIHGLPVVTTSVGVEGMDLEPGRDVAVADDPAALAGAVQALLEDPERWAAQARAGWEWVAAHQPRSRSADAFRAACAAVARC